MRPTTEDRLATQYDGAEFADVRDAKIIERFVEEVDPLNYTLTGLLFKIKCKGYKFNLLVDLDGDGTSALWFADLSMLNTTVDDVMIIEDLVRHEITALCGKTRVEFNEPETYIVEKKEATV